MDHNTINPGGLLRCMECDGFATGIIDHNNDGFVRCSTCTMRSDLKYSADMAPPRNPKTGKLLGCTSKAMQDHDEMFIAGLFRSAMAKVERESQYFREMGVSAHSYLYQATDNAIRYA